MSTRTTAEKRKAIAAAGWMSNFLTNLINRVDRPEYLYDLVSGHNEDHLARVAQEVNLLGKLRQGIYTVDLRGPASLEWWIEACMFGPVSRCTYLEMQKLEVASRELLDVSELELLPVPDDTLLSDVQDQIVKRRKVASPKEMLALTIQYPEIIQEGAIFISGHHLGRFLPVIGQGVVYPAWVNEGLDSGMSDMMSTLPAYGRCLAALDTESRIPGILESVTDPDASSKIKVGKGWRVVVRT